MGGCLVLSPMALAACTAIVDDLSAVELTPFHASWFEFTIELRPSLRAASSVSAKAPLLPVHPQHNFENGHYANSWWSPLRPLVEHKMSSLSDSGVAPVILSLATQPRVSACNRFRSTTVPGIYLH